ncbi:MAG: DM13 domain-containing protein [Pseudomonadota bacterium]
MKAQLTAITFAAIAAIPAAIAIAPIAQAQVIEASVAAQPSGDFVRKAKRLKGAYTVIERDGQTIIRFSDDFRAARGPDLKVFLSPKTVADVTGKTAVDGSINLGELESTRGGQEYLVPEGVNLDDFASVLVHCEAYSVLWGGSDL